MVGWILQLHELQVLLAVNDLPPHLVRKREQDTPPPSHLTKNIKGKNG